MIVAGTWLIAGIIYACSSTEDARDFALIEVGCSVAVTTVGICVISGSGGPRRGDHADLVIHQFNPEIEDLTRRDAERGGSFGIMCCISGILSGVMGYALYSLIVK